MGNDLTRCEQKVMEAIWSGKGEKMTTPEVMERLNKKGIPWKIQTVGTLLTRVNKKGYITTGKTGRKLFYEEKVTKEEYAKKLRQEYDDFCRAAGLHTECFSEEG